MTQTLKKYRKKGPVVVRAHQAEETHFLDLDGEPVHVVKGDYIVHMEHGVHVIPKSIFEAMYEPEPMAPLSYDGPKE